MVKGWSQVRMVSIYWATHVLHRLKQKVTIMKIGVKLKKLPKYRLSYEILGYEVEIVSNCV